MGYIDHLKRTTTLFCLFLIVNNLTCMVLHYFGQEYVRHFNITSMPEFVGSVIAIVGTSVIFYALDKKR